VDELTGVETACEAIAGMDFELAGDSGAGAACGVVSE
jgi:hypothetical protein